ncbi:hypothetical protein [Streptomyces sp. NBC_00503]|uniref:hypothetical protein n=1 Tax=Streptomyces sp. NBC_00503 TaxID=2903659 RepID=UPI002E8017A0|nr:hypothetical protein [Streptomyces sp. NBC_00503]WUD85440.1 hypothetical protein OG490_35490 [Streptomyces sp. NBC_00503]
MPATLPVPIEFRLPDGWLPAKPNGLDDEAVAFAAVHPRPDAGFAANITIDGRLLAEAETLAGVADESVERLRSVGDPELEAQRREVGSADAPALAQRVSLSAVVGGVRRDLVQSQVYLCLQDIVDPHKRAVIRLALTATEAQHDAVLSEFQEFVRTVRPDTGAGA